MKHKTHILSSAILCLLAFGNPYESNAQHSTLQSVMDNNNKTTDVYNHKNNMPGGTYILVDTPYIFSTDYYTPKFTLDYHSDSGINMTTPTGSPAPLNAEGDHVWDMGININSTSGILDPAHGSIGMQWESLYWGGLSAVVPVQEFHLIQGYKNNLGANRFLTYAGLEDGSLSELALNSTKLELGNTGSIVNLCNSGDGGGGMTVLMNGISVYTGINSTGAATFADFINIRGSYPNGGGNLTITDGGATNNNTGISITSTGNNESATISESAAQQFALISAASGASAKGAYLQATNNLTHTTQIQSLGSTVAGAQDEGLLTSNNANGLAIATSVGAPLILDANTTTPAAHSYALQVTPAHNVLIAHADSVGGDLSVSGNVYIHTAASSSSSDSILGKNSLGQIVSVAPIPQQQVGGSNIDSNITALDSIVAAMQQEIATNNSVTANAITAMQQQITANNISTTNIINILQQQMAANDSASLNVIAIMQQQITNLQSQVQQLQATCSINCDAQTNSHLFDNVPNPFTSATNIRYYLANDTSIAYIFVTNISGSLIKEYNITNSTNGYVTFDAEQLPAAIYMYSLMVNGQIVDTKKMVLVR